MDAIIFIFFYFLPAILAIGGRKNSATAIALVNLFFGWMIVGWIVAFIWALSGKSDYENDKKFQTCPYCLERIKVNARVCRYCQRILSPRRK